MKCEFKDGDVTITVRTALLPPAAAKDKFHHLVLDTMAVCSSSEGVKVEELSDKLMDFNSVIYDCYHWCVSDQVKKVNLIKEGQVSLEVNETPSYRSRTKKAIEAEREQLDRARRVQLIMRSWEKNKHGVQPSYMAQWTMRKTNLALCHLTFSDAILQHVSSDDIWHYNLFFPDDLEMSVSVYVDDETSDSVDFSVYHKGELIVANMMPLRLLVKKMKSVLSKSTVNG